MQSFMKTRSRKQKRVAKIQLVTLTAVLVAVLVALPVSADYYDDIEYTAAYEEASGNEADGSDAASGRMAALGEFFAAQSSDEADGLDAASARMVALGEFFTAQRLEAGSEASSARYAGLAALYDQAGGVAVAQDAEMLARNPELKYAYANGQGGAVAASDGSDNPELSAFQRYCSC